MVTLEQIWTPLRVADSQTRVGKVGTHESMAEEDHGVALLELFESTSDPLVILGDPGSGKSTSVAFFAVGAARKWTKDPSRLLPIWVNLSSVLYGGKKDHIDLLLTGVPEIDLAAAQAGAGSASRLAAILRRAIIDGRALVLLDGLDEVKDYALREVRRAISHTVDLHNGARLVVTCRKFDYRQTAPSRKVPIERELELLPYSEEEKHLYVDRWQNSAVRIGRFTPAEATDLASALKVELRSEDLSDLAGSPLLMAFLALIHSEEAKLPDTRAVVCDRAIKYMLVDSARLEETRSWIFMTAAPPVYPLAAEVAYQCDLEEGRIARGPAQQLARSTSRRRSFVSRWLALRPAKRRPVRGSARCLFRSHGPPLDSGTARCSVHRDFQEFLAGQYFAVGAHRAEAVLRGADSHWREPFRLMASLGGHEGENLF